MEAYSVEDGGAGIEFCVYAYNAQPGITIDYKTGDSALAGEEIKPDDNGDDGIPEDGEAPEDEENAEAPEDNEDAEAPENNEDAESSDKVDVTHYILNTNSKKFHAHGCKSAASITEANREERETTRDALIEDGYSPCGICNP